MQKKTTSARGKIEVKIGRFNEPTQDVKVKKNATVEEALEEAGIDLQVSESVWVDGVRADESDKLEAGDFVQIVGNKEGGR